VTELPVVKNGLAMAPRNAGLGTRLHPDVKRRNDASVRTSGDGR